MMSTMPAISDQLAGRVRITQLLDEFSSRVDRGVSVADLMEEQSRFVTPVWNAQGRENIAEKLLSLAQSRKEKGLEARHISTAVNAEDLGSGRFRVRSVMIVMMVERETGANGVMNVVDHDDVVAIGADGICCFLERTMKPALKFALSTP
jgi:hypothetical protein